MPLELALGGAAGSPDRQPDPVRGEMAQDLADMLDLEVERPDMVETTALGAGILAAVGAGLFASLDDAIAAMRGPVRTFVPAMDSTAREERLSRWHRALEAI